MIGTVFIRLQEFVEERMGYSGWQEVLEGAGLPPDKVFRTAMFYPDDYLDKLIASAIVKSGLKRDALLRKLGYHCGKYLVKSYKFIFFPGWNTLDVLEKAAPKVYKSMQFIDMYAQRSTIECKRVSPDEVRLIYKSPRRLCSYVIGIIDAIAEHFDERMEYEHSMCMNDHCNECRIDVKRVKAGRLATLPCKGR